MNNISGLSMANYNVNFNAKKVKLPTKTKVESQKVFETIDEINEKINFEKMNSHEKREYLIRKSVSDGNFFERLISKMKNAFKDSFNDPLGDLSK